MGLTLFTRSSCMEDVEGWVIFVTSPLAMLKLRQSMTARSLVGVMSSSLPLVLIVACPPATRCHLADWRRPARRLERHRESRIYTHTCA